MTLEDRVVRLEERVAALQAQVQERPIVAPIKVDQAQFIAHLSDALATVAEKATHGKHVTALR